MFWHSTLSGYYRLRVSWSLPLIFILMLILSSHFVFPQNTVENNTFQIGEKLVYSVGYSSLLGDFNAGTAIVEVKGSNCPGSSGSKPCFHIVGTGESNKVFDLFYKVRDHFETYIDSQDLLPVQFIRHTREGDYKFDDEVFFDRKNLVAKSSREEKQIPFDVHDIISAVYFMRTLSLDDFGPDSSYFISFFLDDSVYHSEIKYVGKGFLETKWGWLPCLKVKPMMATGEVFSKKYPMTVWITDDENHIPLMAESEIIVGSVMMLLVDYGGLKNPFIKPVKRKYVK